MKMKFWNKRKFWKRLIGFAVIIPVILFTALIAIAYFQQDRIVQHFLKTTNADFKGKVVLEDSHIAPFANFPYISVDLEGVRVFKTKRDTAAIVNLEDIYLGFNVMSLLSGDFNINMIQLADGFVHVHQNEQGDFDILQAFEPTHPIDDVEEEFHFALDEIELDGVDIKKTDPDSLTIDGYVQRGSIELSNKPEHLYMDVDLFTDMSIIEKGDTSILKHKPTHLKTQLDYTKSTQVVQFSESSLDVMNSLFNVAGTIDIDDEFDLDLNIDGKKSDFSLLIALSPDDLIPLFNSFENRGDVFFKANITGKASQGHIPKITADFGCKDGFFKNRETQKTLEELNFVGHFESQKNKGIERMRFEMTDFQARPETGRFKARLAVENFASPDIELMLNTNFELDYLAAFFNVQQLKDLDGNVELEMNFHDIIDLEHPEKSIEKLNESYYTELHVANLQFQIPGYAERFENINIDAHMDGHAAQLDQFHLDVGHSEVNIDGAISDLPALIHHTAIPVEARLNIESEEINLTQLTEAKGEQVVDEIISDLALKLRFNSSARAFTESPHLPIGEFFIEDLHADLSTYPHRFHDFHADVLIDTNDLSVVDFTGELDETDFHFSGKVQTYPMWFQEQLEGDTKIEYDLTSEHFALEDIFTYQGENFVPPDYRHEEITNAKVHGHANLHFKDHELKTTDIWLTELSGKMKMHPLRFSDFSGRVHVEDEHLTLEKFGGHIGQSSFKTDLSYYFGSRKEEKENYLEFQSPFLDFDKIMSYEERETESTSAAVEHDSVFSIFDIPFPDMRYHIDIGRMNYHKYHVSAIDADLRTTENHMLYIDTLMMDIASGHMDITGYFNGADRSEIYFSPDIELNNINMDQLMVKFDNFGQDEIVSDNIHGTLSGRLTGKIHMHADLIPIIDDSEIHLDARVTDGTVEKYAPLRALSDYFEDDALEKVLFDTLENHIDMKNGKMTIPEMVINSNLGFVKISGEQDMQMNMIYYLSVPWKMVAKAGRKKLFGSRKETDSQSIGEYDPDKNYRYINIIIEGDAEDYAIKMGKRKD